MSGLFLFVYDKTKMLHETVGGPPHVTVAYTGKHVSWTGLVTCANGLWLRFMRSPGPVQLVLGRAERSSFQRADGTWRHDVLLMVQNTAEIDAYRETLKGMFPGVHDKFAMLPPHVTAATCDTAEAAAAALARFEKCLPLTVDVTGVYLDS